MSVISEILARRGEDYGDYTDMSIISQNLKKVMRSTSRWEFLTPDKQESLDLFATKIARIMTGDPEKLDSWRDIEGYAKLCADKIERVFGEEKDDQ